MRIIENPPRQAKRRIYLIPLALCLTAMPLQAQDDWLQKGRDLLEDFGKEEATATGLTTGEIAAGLKEALQVGTERVVSQLGQTNGFNLDPAIHIPLPDALADAKSIMEKVGMGAQLDELELRLNRAAEVATPKAKQLFWDAIHGMSLEDVRAIYNGPDNAATQYFRGETSGPLSEAMQPIVDDSLAEVGAIQTYDRIMARYEDLPFVPDIQANLNDYVVDQGMDGIFYYLAREEAAIRENPAERTTDLLKRVFGSGS